MPAEWAPQAAVCLSWPVDDPRHWGGAKRQLIKPHFPALRPGPTAIPEASRQKQIP